MGYLVAGDLGAGPKSPQHGLLKHGRLDDKEDRKLRKCQQVLFAAAAASGSSFTSCRFHGSQCPRESVDTVCGTLILPPLLAANAATNSKSPAHTCLSGMPWQKLFLPGLYWQRNAVRLPTRACCVPLLGCVMAIFLDCAARLSASQAYHDRGPRSEVSRQDRRCCPARQAANCFDTTARCCSWMLDSSPAAGMGAARRYRPGKAWAPTRSR